MRGKNTMTNISFQDVKDVFELLSYIATVAGIPLAIGLYYREKSKERREREYATYNALDEKFIDFLKLCFDNPDLQLEYPINSIERRTPEQEAKQLILFSVLVSIFERAYLMYKDQSTNTKKKQWKGWEEYLRYYISLKDFRQRWREISETYDEDFLKYVEELINEDEARQALLKSQLGITS
jgi:hypothetical protein